jgi:hypothetical protein
MISQLYTLDALEIAYVCYLERIEIYVCVPDGVVNISLYASDGVVSVYVDDSDGVEIATYARRCPDAGFTIFLCIRDTTTNPPPVSSLFQTSFCSFISFAIHCDRLDILLAAIAKFHRPRPPDTQPAPLHTRRLHCSAYAMYLLYTTIA